MQGKQLRKLETELWRAADQLRANSKLTASEYSMPVLGLIFLRHAFNRFQKVKIEVEKDLPTHPQRGKRPLNKKDFEEKNSMFLPECLSLAQVIYSSLKSMPVFLSPAILANRSPLPQPTSNTDEFSWEK